MFERPHHQRIERVRTKATNVFGDREAADRWLSTPGHFVPNAPAITPFDLAATELGARIVETLIAKTVFGHF